MKPLLRSALESLEHWFGKRRRKPLVVRGARQVGKSTLVRLFAERKSLVLAEVNLERHAELEQVFATLDPLRIVANLESVAGVGLRQPGALLFLDEIQATPSALPALRYLHEEFEGLAVIAAGSLLEMVLPDHAFSMPVGRIEYFHLGAMTFKETLHGLGRGHLAALISGWHLDDDFPEAAHRALLTHQREYLLVGGMPEAVAAFAAGDGVNAVRDVHRAIVATYQDDFAKYSSTRASLLRLRRVFNYVPGAVGEKVKYTNIARDERARELRGTIELLALARVIWRVHSGDASGLPLRGQIDQDIFKCLFLDVGLVAHMTGVDWHSLGRWDDRRLTNEGGLAEQFVGQHLLFRHAGLEEPFLSYWLREGRKNNAEVDYVVEQGRRVIPVEVKAGRAGSLKSLHRFFDRQLRGHDGRNIALRFDLNPPSRAVFEHKLSDGSGRSISYELLSLPLYMVEEASRLLAELVDLEAHA